MSVSEKKDVMEKQEKLQESFQEIQRQLAEKKEIVYPFMKKVTNFNEFKKCIMSDAFWTETWCIDTLERLLNVKTVILSQDAYEKNKPILQCFSRHTTSLQTFKPDHYILMSYRKPVYKLITYEGKALHQQLPERIRKLIHTEKPRTCMFRLIPEFNT
jgi:hypothetical protein